MPVEQEISCRQFALDLSVSNQWVTDRIKDGTIKKGVVYINDRPKILKSIALIEVSDYILSDKGGETNRGGRKLEIPEDVLHELGRSTSEREDDDEAELEREDFSALPDNTPKREADRLIALYKARTAKLEYEEAEGNLVKRGTVYEKLHNAAQSVRDKLMNVPERCIDNVLAAPGRNQAIKLMGDEIAAALEELADTNDIQINERR